MRRVGNNQKKVRNRQRKSYYTEPVTYMERVLALNPTAYWPLNEAIGNTAYDYSGNRFDGTYTGVTLGQPGVGDGDTCPRFNGASYVNVYSAALASAFSGTVGTLMIWGKTFNAAIWTDGAERSAANFAKADHSNRIRIQKHSNVNQLRSRYIAGGAAEVRITQDAGPTTAWMQMVMTWNVPVTTLDFYVTNMTPGTNVIGAGWGGVNATNCVIGASSTAPVEGWNGWLARGALWAGRVLNSTEIWGLR